MLIYTKARQRRLQRRIRELQRRCGIEQPSLHRLTHDLGEAHDIAIQPIDAVALPAGYHLPRERHRAYGPSGKLAY